jgi:acyl dehydratase
VGDRSIESLKREVGESRETVVDFDVEAGKVDEFARAVHDDDPIHRDPEAASERGFDAVPAPLTFTRASYLERHRPAGIDQRLGFDLGLEAEHVVHGEQAYEFERPVLVGDALFGETTLEDAYQREGSRGGTLTFVVFGTEYRDAAGDLVVTERTTRIETEGAIGEPPDELPGGGRGIAAGERDRSAAAEPPDPVDPREVSPGDEGPAVVVEELGREDFVRYAGASGDFHRVHYDEPYATAAGNPSVFGQGMLTAGVAASAVAGWLGVENVDRFRTRFEKRLWPGETITAGVEATEKTVEDGTATVAATFSVTTPAGESLLSGDAAATYPLADE